MEKKQNDYSMEYQQLVELTMEVVLMVDVLIVGMLVVVMIVGLTLVVVIVVVLS